MGKSHLKRKDQEEDPEDAIIAELGNFIHSLTEKKLGGEEKVRRSFAKDGLEWVLDLGNLGGDSEEEVEEIASSGQLLSGKTSFKDEPGKKRTFAGPGGNAKRKKLLPAPKSSESSDLESESSAENDGKEEDQEEESEEVKEQRAESEEQREAKRQALLASRKGLPVEIVRLMRGQINRMAESNVLGVARELVKLYTSYSRQDLSEEICRITLSQCNTPNSVVKLIAVNAALIVLLTDMIGLEIAGYCLEEFVRLFQKAYQANDSAVAANFLSFLADLYLFRGIEAGLLYDLLRVFLTSFQEIDIDLILVVVTVCGPQMRKDDPSSLVDVLQAVKAAEAANRDKLTNVRVKFALEQIYELKNNKRDRSAGLGPLEHLLSVVTANVKNKSTRLAISWAQLTSETRQGRWWMVGSAWAHAGNTSFKSSDPGVGPDGTSQELLILAKKHHMNTDIRKAIFCILISAEDYLDAFEKLCKLNLKDKQEREIIHVVLHCCLTEATYNPYYALIASKFCLLARPYQVTMQFALWDKFKELPKGTCKTHEISNLAAFLYDIILKSALPLQVLKGLDFSLTTSHTFVFLRLLIVRLLTEPTPTVFESLFEKLAQSGDKNVKVRQDLLQFFVQGLSNTKFAQKSAKHKALLKDRVTKAKEILERASFSMF